MRAIHPIDGYDRVEETSRIPVSAALVVPAIAAILVTMSYPVATAGAIVVGIAAWGVRRAATRATGDQGRAAEKDRGTTDAGNQ